MNVIKRVFAKMFNKNLPIYGIKDKDLKQYTTTEKDSKVNHNRYPPAELRLKSEDLLGVLEDATPLQSEPDKPVTDDYDSIKQIRD